VSEYFFLHHHPSPFPFQPHLSLARSNSWPGTPRLCSRPHPHGSASTPSYIPPHTVTITLTQLFFSMYSPNLDFVMQPKIFHQAAFRRIRRIKLRVWRGRWRRCHQVLSKYLFLMVRFQTCLLFFYFYFSFHVHPTRHAPLRSCARSNLSSSFVCISSGSSQGKLPPSLLIILASISITNPWSNLSNLIRFFLIIYRYISYASY
jgi:hypothetical protein